jgi:hypothetical protein
LNLNRTVAETNVTPTQQENPLHKPSHHIVYGCINLAIQAAVH